VSKLEVPIRKKRRGGHMQKEGGNKGKVEIDKSFFFKGDLGHLALHDMLILTKSLPSFI